MVLVLNFISKEKKISNQNKQPFAEPVNSLTD